MPNDFYTTVSSCDACAQNRAELKPKIQRQLLLARTPLACSAMHILGPLPRIANGNQYVLVLTGRYSKLT